MNERTTSTDQPILPPAAPADLQQTARYEALGLVIFAALMVLLGLAFTILVG